MPFSIGAEVADRLPPFVADAAASAAPAWLQARERTRPSPQRDDEPSPEPSLRRDWRYPLRGAARRRVTRASLHRPRMLLRERRRFISVLQSSVGSYRCARAPGRTVAGPLCSRTMPAIPIRAAVLDRPGVPSRIEELDAGEPRVGEVRVRMAGVGRLPLRPPRPRRRVGPSGPDRDGPRGRRRHRGARAGRRNRHRAASRSGGSIALSWLVAVRRVPVVPGGPHLGVPGLPVVHPPDARRHVATAAVGRWRRRPQLLRDRDDGGGPGRSGRGRDPDAGRHAAGGRGADRVLRGDGRRGGDEDAPRRAGLERRGHRAGRRRAIGRDGRRPRRSGPDRRRRSRRRRSSTWPARSGRRTRSWPATTPSATAAAIRDATDGGPDVCVEAIGLPSTVELAIACLPTGGTALLVGMTPLRRAGVVRGLSVRRRRRGGSSARTTVRRSPSVDFPRYAAAPPRRTPARSIGSSRRGSRSTISKRRSSGCGAARGFGR